MASTSYMNDPERARRIGQARGNLDKTLRKMEDDARITATALVHGQGGSQDRIAAMQYGPGGADDRRGVIQFGPGGQGDRNNLAHERNVALQFGKGSGYAEHNLANANQANTASELGQFQLGVGRDTRPELLAQNRATFGLNTATNQGELTAKLDENFKKETARTLAMPQYNDPYIKTVPEQPEGWFSKLWSGNLYNPLDPTVAAKRKRESMLKNKTDSLNENFLATNPSYR
jgi:hypothetical protein